ncbi:MAG: hypothetical protein IPN96_18045 [Anaerolineales bacterium]|nr:hypothetical protein [Anaerolineales bacterium]
MLASCSGTAAPVGQQAANICVSPNLPADYEGALAIRNQFAPRTSELIQTELAISPEQAQTLLPLGRHFAALSKRAEPPKPKSAPC